MFFSFEVGKNLHLALQNQQQDSVTEQQRSHMLNYKVSDTYIQKPKSGEGSVMSLE